MRQPYSEGFSLLGSCSSLENLQFISKPFLPHSLHTGAAQGRGKGKVFVVLRDANCTLCLDCPPGLCRMRVWSVPILWTDPKLLSGVCVNAQSRADLIPHCTLKVGPSLIVIGVLSSNCSQLRPVGLQTRLSEEAS